MYTYARTRTPACLQHDLHTQLHAHNRFLSFWIDAVFCVVLSDVLRPLTAGSISERCDSAGKVWQNKSVSAACSS